MKKLLIIILASIAILTSCIIDDPSTPGEGFKSEGIITGVDVRDCMCCGGWFITIGNNQYNFNSLPENSRLSLENEQFPVHVLLDWKPAEGPCSYNQIIVTRIQKK